MKSAVWSRTSNVSYARVDDSHVAYRVIVGDGSGMHDVVLAMGGTVSMEALFEDPVGARLLEGLASLGRLIVFDRRGIGLSDPPVDVDVPYTTRWSDDIAAVVAAAQVARAVLVSGTISWTPTVVYCDRHPDCVAAMVSLEPSPPFRLPPDIIRGQIAGEIDSVALFCPSRADEPGFREWFTRAGRVGASPALAAGAYPTFSDDEAREIERAARRVTAPTLVLRRPASQYSPPAESDPVVTMIPAATRIELPGEDLMLYGGEVDALLAEITRFITGEPRLPAPERALAAIMFSDLVASTERAAAVGDAHWKRILDNHDDVARACIGRRGGALVKIDGDGVLATFPSATNALRAAQDLQTMLFSDGLQVRAGVHVGEIDHRGNDISGLAVNIAARIMHLAAPGEILVSRTVTDIVAGPAVAFADRGEHELKGVPGTWQLFAISRA